MFVHCRIALRCTGTAFLAVLIVGVTLVTPAPTGFPLSPDALWVLLAASALTPAAAAGGTRWGR
ncbi:hypothetical protein ADK70_08745 [Streptomyces rimosus subsp. pseudoverticillatus]|nr:hypothetical protein ADK70_08745 [Streptomyces rimosus subsp. pseudoverticillatus]